MSGGEFSDERHQFVNLSAAEVTADMIEFVDLLRGVNKDARLIVTVSPVPLIATAADRHVLVSTIYSKSALRVAAEELVKARPGIVYFPSYEIITGAYSRGAYFAEDLRSVTAAGVDHVMRLFLKHFTDTETAAAAPIAAAEKPYGAELARALEVVCDEEAIEVAAG